MRVLVIGAGAIGGWLAAVLMRGGAEVSILARGATLAALNESGLILQEDKDQEEYFTIPASDSVADLPQPDAVVLAVKTNNFADAVAGAADALRHGPLVVTAMNGLPWWFLTGLAGPLENQRLEAADPGGRAAKLLAAARPLAAVVHTSARAVRPAVIRVNAIDRLIVGQPDGKTSDATAEFSRLVEAGGASCPISANVRTDIWSKLWGNSNMNPISALTHMTSRRILDDPALNGLVRAMMEEFVRVGRRIGLLLPMTVDQRIAVTHKLGDFRTSMLNDIEADRALELDGLLGVVVEMAEKLGEPAPASRAVYALARAVDPAHRPR